VRRGERWALSAVWAGAAYFVCAWVQQARPTPHAISYDLYQHYYPNMPYLADSVRGGLGGLLWNP
jgi:hypothetical protein